MGNNSQVMSQRYFGPRTITLLIRSNIFNSDSKTSGPCEIIVAANSHLGQVEPLSWGAGGEAVNQMSRMPEFLFVDVS